MGKSYYAAVAVNWADDYDQGLSFDLRLVKDIVCFGCVSAKDVQCDIYDLWSNYRIGTVTNTFSVPAMSPHGSTAYKLSCKYV